MSDRVETDILIVGAGLTGLMTATTLVTINKVNPRKILIVDKGRSVGGRLATRRIGSGRADHGAQFMTVREAEFQRYVDSWLEDGIAYNWSNGWGPNFDGYPRYAIRDGFNNLGKHLARQLTERGVEIRTSVQIGAVGVGEYGQVIGWHAVDETGKTYLSKVLVLTSPVPQSLALIDAGNTVLDASDRAALDKLEYAPCLCGLFRFEGETLFEEPGVALNPDDVVSWMADNQRKGISPDARLVTVHAGPAYSRANYEVADVDILTTLRESLRPFLSQETEILEEQVKRWRYAQPLELYPDRFLQAIGLPALYFGGDIFGGPRVEGASLSGIAIGKSLASL